MSSGLLRWLVGYKFPGISKALSAFTLLSSSNSGPTERVRVTLLIRPN